MIQKIVGYKGKILWNTSQPDGSMRKVLNTERMVKVLGYEKSRPCSLLDKGLEKTIKWYMDNKKEADARI